MPQRLKSYKYFFLSSPRLKAGRQGLLLACLSDTPWRINTVDTTNISSYKLDVKPADPKNVGIHCSSVVELLLVRPVPGLDDVLQRSIQQERRRHISQGKPWHYWFPLRNNWVILGGKYIWPNTMIPILRIGRMLEKKKRNGNVSMTRKIKQEKIAAQAWKNALLNLPCFLNSKNIFRYSRFKK